LGQGLVGYFLKSLEHLAAFCALILVYRH
jgi:hypothetical protein